MSASSETLSTIRAILPSADPAIASRLLHKHHNNLELVVDLLIAKQDRDKGSLNGWLVKKDDKSDKRPPRKKRKKEQVTATKQEGPSAFDRLRHPGTAAEDQQKAKRVPIKVLNTPEEVYEGTGGLCTLIPRVLDKELAVRLFLSNVRESNGEGGKEPWDRNRWYLNDRHVESPHTTHFYVSRSLTSPSKSTTGYSSSAVQEAAKFWYNGTARESRFFTPEMDEARAVIRPLVNSELKKRERDKELEYEAEWEPNVAAANCYRGVAESVGWHSDVLTYLGPLATIASLTLGVTRPFRLRPASGVPGAQTLEIPLPHNTLLIMHRGVQERFKHTVPEVRVCDVWKVPRGVEVPEEMLGAGKSKESTWNERMNMTFRFYRPDFAPSTTPLCHCSEPCVLRPDLKGRVRANQRTSATSASNATATSSKIKAKEKDEQEQEVEAEMEKMLYFWQCTSGQQDPTKGCSFFKVLDMQKEGRGRAFATAAAAKGRSVNPHTFDLRKTFRDVRMLVDITSILSLEELSVRVALPLAKVAMDVKGVMIFLLPVLSDEQKKLAERLMEGVATLLSVLDKRLKTEKNARFCSWLTSQKVASAVYGLLKKIHTEAFAMMRLLYQVITGRRMLTQKEKEQKAKEEEEERRAAAAAEAAASLPPATRGKPGKRKIKKKQKRSKRDHSTPPSTSELPAPLLSAAHRNLEDLLGAVNKQMNRHLDGMQAGLSGQTSAPWQAGARWDKAMEMALQVCDASDKAFAGEEGIAAHPSIQTLRARSLSMSGRAFALAHDVPAALSHTEASSTLYSLLSQIEQVDEKTRLFSRVEAAMNGTATGAFADLPTSPREDLLRMRTIALYTVSIYQALFQDAPQDGTHPAWQEWQEWRRGGAVDLQDRWALTLQQLAHLSGALQLGIEEPIVYFEESMRVSNLPRAMPPDQVVVFQVILGGCLLLTGMYLDAGRAKDAVAMAEELLRRCVLFQREYPEFCSEPLRRERLAEVGRRGGRMLLDALEMEEKRLLGEPLTASIEEELRWIRARMESLVGRRA